MPWFAVGLSILATLFSTLTYLGAPGEVIKNGFGHFLGFLAIPFGMAVVMLLWIPFFMRLKLTSAYEYLELRFNYPVRCIGASLFILLRLGWMSMVIFAASLALDRVKGPDVSWLPGHDIYWWICLIGLVAAVYTSIGGIQAMIWTDVLQFVMFPQRFTVIPRDDDDRVGMRLQKFQYAAHLSIGIGNLAIVR